MTTWEGSPELSAEPSGARWLMLVLVMALVWLLLFWAGAGGIDVRHGEFWHWGPGGFAWSPGLGWIWVGAAGLALLLSFWAAMTDRAERNRVAQGAGLESQASGVALILLTALGLRFWMLMQWAPSLGGGLVHEPWTHMVAYRWAVVIADMGVVAALLNGLVRQGRSVGWAALYAWHPLVVIEAAGNSRLEPAMVMLLAVALAQLTAVNGVRRWWVGIGFGIVAAAGFVFSMEPAWLGGGMPGVPVQEQFNSFGPRLLEAVGVAGGGTLWLWRIVLLAGVVALGWWRKWPLAKTVGHALIIWFLLWTRVYPWHALWPLAVSVLAWNRAAWVWSITALAGYAIYLTGDMKTGSLPEWLWLVMWLPVAVVELEQLVSDTLPRRAPATPVRITSRDSFGPVAPLTTRPI